MTFRRLLLSGTKVGMMAAMRGSFYFILIAVPVFGREILFSVENLPVTIVLFFYGFIFGVVTCLIYSILPGILGGIILALWLSRKKINFPRILWISGGFVGGLSGLLISMFFIVLRGETDQSPFDQSALILGAILATLIAGSAGVWSAFRLHRIILSSEASTENEVTVDTK